MTEPGDLLVGIRKSSGYIITDTINGVTMNAGTCRDFRVGTADGLGIVGNESAYFTAAIKLINTKAEMNLANNKIIKYLSVTSAASILPNYNSNPWTTPWYPDNTYGTADFMVQNIRYVPSVNAYRDTGISTVYNAFAADVCNYGDSVSFSQNFQATFIVNNHTEYVTLRPNYGNLASWNRSECRTLAVEISKFGIWNNISN